MTWYGHLKFRKPYRLFTFPTFLTYTISTYIRLRSFATQSIRTPGHVSIASNAVKLGAPLHQWYYRPLWILKKYFFNFRCAYLLEHVGLWALKLTELVKYLNEAFEKMIAHILRMAQCPLFENHVLIFHEQTYFFCFRIQKSNSAKRKIMLSLLLKLHLSKIIFPDRPSGAYIASQFPTLNYCIL